MRVYGHERSQGPSWVLAILIFVGLLLALQLFRGRQADDNALAQQFAARPYATSTRSFDLPPLPSSVAGLAGTAAARITRGGAAPALTPVAEGSGLRVEITRIRQVSGGLQIAGTVANTGSQPLPITLGNFRFSDETGTVYAAENDVGTTLDPGQHAPLDLTLPIPSARELTLDIQIDGQPPIHMILIQTPS